MDFSSIDKFFPIAILMFFGFIYYMRFLSEKNERAFELERLKLQYLRERDCQILRIRETIIALKESDQNADSIYLCKLLNELIYILQSSNTKPCDEKTASVVNQLERLIEKGSIVSTLAVNIRQLLDWLK